MRIGCVHQVHAGQVLIGWHNVQGILARNIHEVRQTCTRTHEDALETLFVQVLYGNCLTNNAVGNEFYTHFLKILNFYIHDGIRQTELWNTIFQYSANLVKCLEYSYVESLLGHIACETQTGRTRAYYCYLYTIGWFQFWNGNVSALALVVSCKSLKISDCHCRLVHLEVDTFALALFLLWTYTTANGRQGRGVFQNLSCC